LTNPCDFLGWIDAGDYIYISGQSGQRSDGSIPADFDAQASQSLENIKSIISRIKVSVQGNYETYTYRRAAAEEPHGISMANSKQGHKSTTRETCSQKYENWLIRCAALYLISTNRIEKKNGGLWVGRGKEGGTGVRRHHVSVAIVAIW